MAINPLSIPGYASPQALDFTPLAQLGQVYQQGQAQRAKQQALSQLGQGGQADINALIQSGDMSLANLGLQLQQRQQAETRDARDFAFRQDEARRAQANADRAYGLQVRTANRADEDKPVFKEVTNADGSTAIYRIMPRDPSGKAVRVDMGPPQQTSGGNPFGPGKFNEGQGKAAGFSDRMLQSEKVLLDNEGQGSSVKQYMIANPPIPFGSAIVPDIAKNWAHSKEYQQYDQAKRDFINAQLRRESGATIMPSEFESADKQYFPRPNDSAEVIAQKRANRHAAIKAMGREGGPSYQPEYVIDDSGKVVPYGKNAEKPSSQSTQAAPKPGQLVDGYRFKGGNPADPNSWVKAQ